MAVWLPVYPWGGPVEGGAAPAGERCSGRQPMPRKHTVGTGLWYLVELTRGRSGRL